jgi:hypothetical protein
MADGFMLKFLGDLFYLVVALCALYGLLDFFRAQRAVNSAVIKAHVTAYELQKMIESRPGRCRGNS